jgi:hypothetical protein
MISSPKGVDWPFFIFLVIFSWNSQHFGVSFDKIMDFGNFARVNSSFAS